MSVIDDTRKLLQDFVTPEFQSLKAELKSVEEKSKLRDDALSQKIDLKFDLLVEKIDRLAASLNLDRRLEAVEKRLADPLQAA
jgi:hypothetical protein